MKPRVHFSSAATLYGLLLANTARWIRGEATDDEFRAAQWVLWDHAAEEHCVAEVIGMLNPSATRNRTGGSM